MSKFSIEQAIEKSTQDGKLDSKLLMKAIDEEYVNPIVASKKPDQDKLIAETKEKWIQGLNFEGVENEAQLKAYVKGTSDEWKEKYSELEKQRNQELEGYKDYDSLQEKVRMYDNYSILQSKGISDPDTLEFLNFKINKLEGETFNDKLTAYEAMKPETFQEKKITTGARIGVKSNTEKLGFEEILEDKYGDLK